MVYLSSSKIGVEQGITTRTLQSGLIEKSGKIVCHQSEVDASISHLKNDFQNIYPDPTIRFRNDGLAEIDWSSYDTASGSIPPNFGSELLSLSQSYSLSLGNNSEQRDWTITEQWLCDVVVEKFTIPLTKSPVIAPSARFLQKKLISQKVIGIIQDEPERLNIIWTKGIRSIDRNNYGEVEAVSVVTGYSPQVQ